MTAAGQPPLRPKIALIIQSDNFVRNYVATGVLSSLSSLGDVRAICSSDIRDPDPLRNAGVRVDFYDSYGPVRWRHYFLFNVLMWRHRDRSKSFRFRAARFLGLPLSERSSGLRGQLGAWGHFARRALRHPRVLMTFLLGQPGVAELFSSFYRRCRLPANESLRRVILSESPDVLIVPSTSYEPVANDAMRIAARAEISTVMLVDNWDNLSSKSVLWTKPDLMGVWGPQSVRHAIEIQRMAPDRVVPIGTPRFDHYFAARESELPSPFDFDYVLFVGCAVAFDETSALRALEREIASDPATYSGLRVVYRPHPWRHERKVEEPFDPEEFAHVVADKQIGRSFDHRETSVPGLDYYAPLLSNARFVVGAPTTMVLEAMIFRRPVIVLAYDDGVHVSTPSLQVKYYEHLEGLDRLRGTRLCDDLAALEAAFRSVYRGGAGRPVDSDRQLAHYLTMKPGTYQERLHALVSAAIRMRGDGGGRSSQ